MQTEQKLTNFNARVQNLRAITGQSQAEIAAVLEISRTTLHYYCTGQSDPKPPALFRLEQAEQRAAANVARPALYLPTPSLADRPLPEDPALFADERPRSEVELSRHLRWLQGARLRQQEAALAAQRHLHEIDGWIHETEGELSRVRETSPSVPNAPAELFPGPVFVPPRSVASPRQAARAELRDIDTVSLPIFGALPAGWPQTREGVMARRPARTVSVRRGQFPEGAFGLEVRGDSMNAARPAPILDRDIVVLVSPEQREPKPEDIVAALIDGETCLKRLKLRKKKAYLKSESTNPAHGEIHPTHDLMIQGVFVGKL